MRKTKVRERCGLCIFRGVEEFCWLKEKMVKNSDKPCAQFRLGMAVHDGKFITSDQADNVRRALYG